MIESFFVEQELKSHPRTERILKKIPHKRVQYIERYDHYFGRVKRPYLQKRESLNAFIAQKKGQLIKEAPDAYGLSGEPHYYFIHAYNCIYECQYCYLQGHFHSPDLVFFINHEQIVEQMEKICREFAKQKRIWFHAGEFSDSLALTHATGELAVYHQFLKNYPQAIIELRTKSANIKELCKLAPLENLITSFSLSPQTRSKITDLKTPPTHLRLKAMKQLMNRGHRLAIHLDPVVYSENFESEYRQLIKEITENIPPEKIEYISAGVVRFTKDVYQQVKKNYPESDIHAQEMISSFDDKIRYPRPMRLWMLSKIKDLLIQGHIDPNKIYLCMED